MAQTKILVVEDDAPIRRGLVDALRFAGYEVEECATGDRAIDAVCAQSPDLLLQDIVLPGKDGFAILDELRESHPQMAVIMLTARGAEEDRVRGLKRGADDYVVKPFSATELLARVEAVLRRSAERPTDLRELKLSDRTVHLLALARGMARDLGGELTLESPADGGARFRVELPTIPSRNTGRGDSDAPGHCDDAGDTCAVNRNGFRGGR